VSPSPACRRPDCPGLSDWRIVHPVQVDGQTVIVDEVPAGVCLLCGETRLSGETRERLEQLLRSRPNRARIPFLEFDDGGEPG